VLAGVPSPAPGSALDGGKVVPGEAATSDGSVAAFSSSWAAGAEHASAAKDAKARATTT